MRVVFLLSFLFLCSCALTTQEQEPPNLVLKPVSFSDLPGWGKDDLKTFATAFEKTCDRILKGNPDKKMGALEQAGSYKDWQTRMSKL